LPKRRISFHPSLSVSPPLLSSGENSQKSIFFSFFQKTKKITFARIVFKQNQKNIFQKRENRNEKERKALKKVERIKGNNRKRVKD